MLSYRKKLKKVSILKIFFTSLQTQSGMMDGNLEQFLSNSITKIKNGVFSTSNKQNVSLQDLVKMQKLVKKH